MYWVVSLICKGWKRNWTYVKLREICGTRVTRNFFSKLKGVETISRALQKHPWSQHKFYAKINSKFTLAHESYLQRPEDRDWSGVNFENLKFHVAPWALSVKARKSGSIRCKILHNFAKIRATKISRFYTGSTRFSWALQIHPRHQNEILALID